MINNPILSKPLAGRAKADLQARDVRRAEKLGERVRELRDPAIDRVEAALLELAEPSIPQGLACCAARGAAEIVMFPHFLASDIPEALAAFQQGHPDIRRLATHLGASPALAGNVLDVAGQPG